MAKVKHIYIYGDIVNAQTDPEIAAQYGFVNLKTVVDQAGTGKEDIVLHIHSRGGEVDEGFAIYDFLVGSGRKVSCKIEGLCKSIATIIALAAADREMTENSTFMIHNPWGGAVGDASALKEYADEVKAIENRIANFYVEKTGAKLEDIQAWMKEEKTMSAAEAQTLGFVTSVLKTVTALAIGKRSVVTSNSFDMNKIVSEIKAMKEGIISALKGEKPKGSAVKNLDLKTSDGKTLVVETDADAPAVGNKCTIDGNPAPDGEYTLESGTKITVASGAITVITEAAQDNDDVVKLKAEITTLKAQNNQLAEDLTSAKNDVAEVLALAKTMKSGFKPQARANKFESQLATAEDKDSVTREDMEERRKAYKKNKSIHEMTRG